jgi:hypothetical protein
MGDFIRFILTKPHDLSLESIENGLKATDPEFAILVNQASPSSGDILLGGELYGELELNLPSDQVFTEDIEDLLEQLTDIPDGEKAAVVQALAAATGMIAFGLAEYGHDNYRRIDPFWDWLFERYEGVLQIDEEGYYSRDEHILFVE